MVEFRGAWNRDGVEGFLDDVVIPIRLAVHKPDGTLWVVALWFRYRDGGFDCVSEANSHVIRFLRANPSIGFDVSTNRVPYRGVRGNGTVSLEPDTDKTVLRALLERYLGTTESDLAAWLLSDGREEIHVRLEPEAVFSWDYSERMASAAEP